MASGWDDQVRDAFLVLLKEGDPDLRRLAADALAQNCKKGDRAAAAVLLKALGDTHPAAKLRHCPGDGPDRRGGRRRRAH